MASFKLPLGMQTGVTVCNLSHCTTIKTYSLHLQIKQQLGLRLGLLFQHSRLPVSLLTFLVATINVKLWIYHYSITILLFRSFIINTRWYCIPSNESLYNLCLEWMKLVWVKYSSLSNTGHAWESLIIDRIASYLS